ncbi:MAG: hypothetical protein JW728_04835 [Candidatus Aureabacteria bacterium]|nr:hypothetical protein [Candidatus Auribacterota bacterium]
MSRKRPYFINKLMLVFICLFSAVGVIAIGKNRIVSVIAWVLCFVFAVCAIIVSVMQIRYLLKTYKTEKDIIKENFKKSLRDIH